MKLYEGKSLWYLANKYNINYDTLKYRIKRGIKGDDLFITPNQKRQYLKCQGLTERQKQYKIERYMNYHNIKWGDFCHLPEYFFNKDDLAYIKESYGK